MTVIRSFVAIPIPDFAKDIITSLQARFLPLNIDAKWVPASNIHLTLKFFGEISQDLVPGIAGHIRSLAANFSPFSLQLHQAGVFPNFNRPRVVWVGVAGSGMDVLESLHSQINKELQSLGIPQESRKFSPHLTLGRLKSTQGNQELRKIINDSSGLASKPFEVESISLYKSQLRPQGAIYTVLETFPLSKT